MRKRPESGWLAHGVEAVVLFPLPPICRRRQFIGPTSIAQPVSLGGASGAIRRGALLPLNSLCRYQRKTRGSIVAPRMKAR